MASAAGFVPGGRERRFFLDDLVEAERKPFRAVDLGTAASRPGSSFAHDTLSLKAASLSPLMANAVTLVPPA
ncbi:MAG: hypothetical protein ACREC4_07410 [Methylocella sp.]